MEKRITWRLYHYEKNQNTGVDTYSVETDSEKTASVLSELLLKVGALDVEMRDIK